MFGSDSSSDEESEDSVGVGVFITFETALASFDNETLGTVEEAKNTLTTMTCIYQNPMGDSGYGTDLKNAVADLAGIAVSKGKIWTDNLVNKIEDRYYLHPTLVKRLLKHRHLKDHFGTDAGKVHKKLLTNEMQSSKSK